jgi:hypothetical protein
LAETIRVHVGVGENTKSVVRRFDEKDFHYRRLRRVEADLILELLAYGLETLGPEAIEDAWREFHDYAAPGAYDPDSPINSVFMPWFLFNWIHETRLPDSPYFSDTTNSRLVP